MSAPEPIYLRPPADLVLRFLRDYETYFLFSHIEPDGDCLCSSAALGRFLQGQGKQVFHFNEGPFIRVEVQSYQEDFLSSVPETIPANAAAVVLDCSTPDRVGAFADTVSTMPSLVIDHHRTGDSFGDVTYIEPDAPSTTLLIQFIIEAFHVPIERDVAELLLFGLCTDTGFFRHMTAGQGAVFAAVGRLVDQGASPKAAHARMFGGRTVASRQLLARLIARARELNAGRCMITFESLDDIAEFGKESRDSDLLYQLLLGTQHCSVIALVRAESPSLTSISFRARDNTDVGSIARSLGGGGHRAAAGCQVKQPLATALRTTEEILSQLEIQS